MGSGSSAQTMSGSVPTPREHRAGTEPLVTRHPAGPHVPATYPSMSLVAMPVLVHLRASEMCQAEFSCGAGGTCLMGLPGLSEALL
jgi:hypothetical protein